MQSILNAAGVGRLDRGDRATAAPGPVRRYQRERPGELVHVDVKKLAGIREGGGWRILGRSAATTHTGSGYRYLHTAIDDRTRLVYSEIHDDEKAVTAAGLTAAAERSRRHEGRLEYGQTPRRQQRAADALKSPSEDQGQDVRRRSAERRSEPDQATPIMNIRLRRYLSPSAPPSRSRPDKVSK